MPHLQPKDGGVRTATGTMHCVKAVTPRPGCVYGVLPRRKPKGVWGGGADREASVHTAGLLEQGERGEGFGDSVSPRVVILELSHEALTVCVCGLKLPCECPKGQ